MNIGYHPDTMSRRRMTNAGKRRKGKKRGAEGRQKMWGRPSGAPNQCPHVSGALRARARGARCAGFHCRHAPEGRKPQGNKHISRAHKGRTTRQPCADEMGAKARSPHEKAHTWLRIGRESGTLKALPPVGGVGFRCGAVGVCGGNCERSEPPEIRKSPRLPTTLAPPVSVAPCQGGGALGRKARREGERAKRADKISIWSRTGARSAKNNACARQGAGHRCPVPRRGEREGGGGAMGATIGSPEWSPCPRRARGFYACTCVRGRASVRAFALNALIACLLQVCCLEIRRRYYCTAYSASE